VNSDTPPTPVARQARSRETQERIFAAGTRLLEEGGPEALTVVAVAEAAGVSVGGIYRRFGDKDRLLLAIQARFTARFAAEFAQRVSQLDISAVTPPATVIAAAVEGVAGSLRAHERLLQVFMVLGMQNPAVREHGSAISVEGGRAFRDTVMLAAAALRQHPDVEAAIDFAYRLVYAACAHRILHGEYLESRRPLSWPDLIERLAQAVTAYLLGTPE